MNHEGTKVSVDVTKMLSDVNSSGPTAHIEATSLTMNMAMENQSSLVDTTGLGSYPPLPKQVATLVDNAPSKPSYANVTSKPSGKKLNFCTLFTPGGESGWHTLFSMDGLDAMLENGPWFIRNNPLILRKWHPDENPLKEDVSTIPVWVKLHDEPVTAFSEDGLSAIATKLADVELKDNIVTAMDKITREGYYTCNIHNIGAGAIKNLKKTSQTPKGIPVGQKLGFKPK
ncbi:retrotransposon protein, putative, ty1-copia subclass [Tanacetum coccineum]